MERHHIVAEGLYDSTRGMMKLIGCSSPLTEFSDNVTDTDFNNNILDCDIQISIQYPALNNRRWFETLRWMVSITSTRPPNDKSFFKPINIILGPYSLHNTEREDVSHKVVHSVLQLVALLGCLYCILEHLAGLNACPLKLRDNPYPFYSLTKLFFQWTGMVLPLAMYLFSLITDPVSSLIPKVHDQDPLVMELIEALINIARSLCCFALIFLFISVKRARREQHPAKARECLVMEICTAIYMVMFVLYMAMGALDTMETKTMAMSRSFWLFYVTSATRWKTDLEEFGGYLLDLFLLPPVVQNCVVCTQNRRILLPLFYVGITIMQSGLHLHNLFFWKWKAPETSEKPSIALELSLPCLSILLALTLHLQQTKVIMTNVPIKFRWLKKSMKGS